MAAHNANNNGSISWQHIVVLISIGGLAIGGLWAVSQTQLTALEKQTLARVDALKDLADIMRRENDVIRTSILSIQSELERRRGEFLGQSEFKQFEARMRDIDEIFRSRLQILEQTRPTTGELSGVLKALELQTKDILARSEFNTWKRGQDDRLKSMEDNIRRLTMPPR